MKRVTFEIAKALKNAGFHEVTSHFYKDTYDDEDNPTHQFELCGASIPNYIQDWNDTNKHPEYDEGHVNYWRNVWSAPTYLDVWLWLWREKKVSVYTEECLDKWAVFELGSNYSREGYIYNDPEEAIIAAIEYLVKNNLIK